MKRLPAPRGYKKSVTRLGVTRVRGYNREGLLNPHVDAYKLGVETAREELSILTVLSNEIARGLNFPRRLPHSIGWLDAAFDESPPPLTVFSG